MEVEGTAIKSSGEDSWDALPPRKKRTRGETLVTSKSHHNIGAGRIVPLHMREIDQAVQARSESLKADTTLQSRDGCDGDNYECIFIFFTHLIIFLIS
jgi:hypothetical protein